MVCFLIYWLWAEMKGSHWTFYASVLTFDSAFWSNCVSELSRVWESKQPWSIGATTTDLNGNGIVTWWMIMTSIKALQQGPLRIMGGILLDRSALVLWRFTASVGCANSDLMHQGVVLGRFKSYAWRSRDDEWCWLGLFSGRSGLDGRFGWLRDFVFRGGSWERWADVL